VMPKLGPLTRAAGTIPTLRGFINVTAGPGALDVAVPCNTAATLCSPRSAADAPPRLTAAAFALTIDGEEVAAVERAGHLCALKPVGCGAGGAPPFGSGTVLRAPGWIAPSATAAAALGWAAVRQPETNATVGATPGALWRCRAALGGPEGSGGDSVATATVYSAAFDDPTCAAAGPGYVPDRLLGYALGPLTTARLVV